MPCSPRLLCTPVLPGPSHLSALLVHVSPGSILLQTNLCSPCFGCPSGFHASISMHQRAPRKCMAPEGSLSPCADDEGTSPQTSADALSTPSPPHSRSSGGSLDAAQAEAAYSRQKLKGKAVMRPGEAGLQSAQAHIISAYGSGSPVTYHKASLPAEVEISLAAAALVEASACTQPQGST